MVNKFSFAPILDRRLPTILDPLIGANYSGKSFFKYFVWGSFKIHHRPGIYIAPGPEENHCEADRHTAYFRRLQGCLWRYDKKSSIWKYVCICYPYKAYQALQNGLSNTSCPVLIGKHLTITSDHLSQESHVARLRYDIDIIGLNRRVVTAAFSSLEKPKYLNKAKVKFLEY